MPVVARDLPISSYVNTEDMVMICFGWNELGMGGSESDWGRGKKKGRGRRGRVGGGKTGWVGDGWADDD